VAHATHSVTAYTLTYTLTYTLAYTLAYTRTVSGTQAASRGQLELEGYRLLYPGLLLLTTTNKLLQAEGWGPGATSSSGLGHDSESNFKFESEPASAS
jgi:hypothetical protein